MVSRWCYETLGVPLHASPAEIRAAYRQLVQLRRPDASETVRGSEQQGAANRMRAIHDAYERMKGAPLRYHVAYKGESTSGKWNLPTEPSEDFVRASLELSEASPRRNNLWYRTERRLQNEPLAFALLALGAIQLVFGLTSWETGGLSSGESVMPTVRGILNPVRLVASGLLGSIGAAAVLAMPRYRLWLVLSLALAQGFIVNLTKFWLIVGVLAAVAIAVQIVDETYGE